MATRGRLVAASARRARRHPRPDREVPRGPDLFRRRLGHRTLHRGFRGGRHRCPTGLSPGRIVSPHKGRTLRSTDTSRHGMLPKASLRPDTLQATWREVDRAKDARGTGAHRRGPISSPTKGAHPSPRGIEPRPHHGVKGRYEKLGASIGIFRRCKSSKKTQGMRLRRCCPRRNPRTPLFTSRFARRDPRFPPFFSQSTRAGVNGALGVSAADTDRSRRSGATARIPRSAIRRRRGDA